MTWKPHDGAQERFHQYGAFEGLYGGSAGGGKTDSLLMEATRQVAKKDYKGILFRRTYPELELSLILRAYEHYPSIGGMPRDGGRKWEFPSGAAIWFGHLEHEKDVYKYQSAEFDFIGFDELTSFTEFQYLYLFSRCRGSAPEIKRYVRSGTNPGNVGHGWVKKRFIEGKEPYKIYLDEFGHTRFFVPARVWDNPTLLKNDPGYINRLKLLPHKQQRMLLDGDWNVFEGQFFEEWDESLHVCVPFNIPDDWEKYISIDYGHSAPSAVYWNAIVPNSGKVYTYREFYQTGQTYLQLAKTLTKLTPAHETIDWIVADNNIAAASNESGQGGDAIIRDYFESVEWDVPFTLANKGAGSRKRGWNLIREYLHPNITIDGKVTVKWQVFNTCPKLIELFPDQIHDDNDPEDLDTKGEDHAPDSIRYGLQSIGQPLTVKVKRKKVGNKYGILTAAQLFEKVETDN